MRLLLLILSFALLSGCTLATKADIEQLRAEVYQLRRETEQAKKHAAHALSRAKHAEQLAESSSSRLGQTEKAINKAFKKKMYK